MAPFFGSGGGLSGFFGSGATDDALPSPVAPSTSDYRWNMNNVSGSTITATRGGVNITGLVGTEGVHYNWTGTGLQTTVDFSGKTTTVADTTANTLTIASGHGIVNGTTIRYTTTGTLPAPLIAGTNYFFRNETATTYTPYDTLAHAQAGGATGLIDITDSGSGVHTMTPQDTFSFASPNGTLSDLTSFTAYFPITFDKLNATTMLFGIGDGTTSGAASVISVAVRYNRTTTMFEARISNGTTITTVGLSNSIPLGELTHFFLRHTRNTAAGTDSITQLDYTFDDGATWYSGSTESSVAVQSVATFELRNKLDGASICGTRHDIAVWRSVLSDANLIWLAQNGPEDTTY